MTGSIWDLKTITGEPMFYAPGSHPATYRLREHRRLLRAHLDQVERAEREGIVSAEFAVGAIQLAGGALAYIDAQITAFEEQESEMKYQYARLLRRMDQDGPG